jgi:cyclic beta-1,2-glucan synthetase
MATHYYRLPPRQRAAGACSGADAVSVSALRVPALRPVLGDRKVEHQASLVPWDRTPLRAELFGVERLEQHARSLAAAQPVTEGRIRDGRLAVRLAGNAAFLLQANRALAKAAEDGHHATPAAEWLADNYHLVDMQIREIGIDLPAGFYAQLPKLAVGPFTGLPRVFGAMWSLVAHTDSHFDLEALRRYLIAYQSVQPLTIGELWAVPIVLRIVLIENLRRIAELVVDDATVRQAADALADRVQDAGINGASLSADLSDDPTGCTRVTNPFAVQLAHRLRGHDPRTNPALAWLDRRLATQGTTVEVVVRDELQKQGMANATVRNVITSLRTIAGMDWTEAFERISLVDAVLAGTALFTDMDFATRNLYRTAIEALSRGSDRSELDIARAASAAAAKHPGERRGDPGYYLISGGRPGFEVAMGYRPTLRVWLERRCRKLGIGGYGAAIVALALAFVSVPLRLAAEAGTGTPWLIGLGGAGFVLASDAAVACINRLATWAFGATALPGLALETGIPASLRTLVVVPVLLTTEADVANQVERLEIHHLASQDGEVHFALLSDWTDSRVEHAERDAALLAAATSGIARLNRLYSEAAGGPRFLLLHRRRVWNAGEDSWIGWERKRGKRALRRHTGRRHAAAARRRAAYGGQDGAPAQRAAGRPIAWAGCGRTCSPAAAGHAVFADGTGQHRVPTHLFEHGRYRSLRSGCVGRVSGHV